MSIYSPINIGMNHVLSILLPTRKRVALLKNSMASLMDRASKPDLVEICLAYDDDDNETADYLQCLEWRSMIERWRCTTVYYRSPRWGYADLQKYVNELAVRSRGQWLLFWNDDAVMQTPGWDDHVRANWNHRMLLHMSCSNHPMHCSIFPLVNREWLDLFGQLCPINHTDSWISDICTQARARKVIPVAALHDRFDETGRNNDATWQDRQGYSNRIYHLPEHQQARQEWARRLETYLKTVA